MKKYKNIKIHAILIIGSFIMLGPFLWTISTSFKTLYESMMFPPKLLPNEFNFKNYRDILTLLPFNKFYLNTFLMVFWRVVCALFFSSLAGYSLARLEFKGKKLFFGLVLSQMMVPAQIFIIPQFLLAQKLGILNTVTALVMPGMVSAYGTFLMRQFFKGMPKDLEQAAIIDGCNRWQIFWRIMLPLAKAPLISLGILTSLFAFKDLMWPLVVNMSIEKMTLSAGVASLQGQFETNFPNLMAGSVLTIWPMILLFIIFQKFFIQGIANSGSKE